MTERATLSNGQEIWISSFTGEVLSENRTQHTEVHQTAPTYIPTANTNGVASVEVVPGQVYSTVHTNHKVWLRNARGNEKQVDLGNMGLSIRVGHVITVAWGQTTKNESGHYFAALNHTTDEICCDIFAALDKVLKQWKLDIGQGAWLWQWLGGGILLSALIGAASIKGEAALSAAFIGACLGVIPVLITFPLWVSIRTLMAEHKVKDLLAEINDIARKHLQACAQ